MGCTLFWNENPLVLHVRLTGALTEAAYLESRDVVARMLAERGRCAVIVDFSSIREFDLSISAVKEIARRPGIAQGCCVVVAPRPVVFGSVRMVQMIRESAIAEDAELHVVQEIEDAYTMLGVSTPEFRRVSPPEGLSAAAHSEKRSAVAEPCCSIPRCPYCTVDPDDAWGVTNAIALLAPGPLVPGQCVVAPRRHVSKLFELDVAEQQAIWSLIALIRERIRADLNVKAFHLGFAEFRGAGGHMHVHVVPQVLGQRVDLPADVEWLST